MNPLKWWHDNRHVYPTLYRMALDYLSIPGESLSISFHIIAKIICSDIYGSGTRLLPRSTATPLYMQPTFTIIYSCLSVSWVMEPA